MILPPGTRVHLCDDHELFLGAFATVLAGRGVDVVATTRTAEACLTRLAEDPVDLCVVDRWLPDRDGLDLVPEIRALAPDTKILMLSGSADPGLVAAARVAGASGFATKELGVDRLVDLMARVCAGEVVEERAFRGPPTPIDLAARTITPRERAVLARLVQGKDTAALASELGISYATARTHIQNLLCKLGVHSKLELVAVTVRHDLLSPFAGR